MINFEVAKVKSVGKNCPASKFIVQYEPSWSQMIKSAEYFRIGELGRLTLTFTLHLHNHIDLQTKENFHNTKQTCCKIDNEIM